MRLAVPHFPQQNAMDCWHASARMLWAYQYSQSIDPLPDVFNGMAGIQPAEFIRLAKSLGLSTFPQVNECYGATFLIDNIMHIGPLWAAGQWNGPNHIIVITGAEEDGTVYVNDPAFATPQVREIGWFNEKIDKSVSEPMMFLA